MASRTFATSVLCRRAVTVRIMQRGFSAVAHPQSQADFLNGAPHRKHPGVTNLKTLHLPQELQSAAQTVIHDSAVTGLAERAHSLSNFLWSRKRSPEDAMLRDRALSLEKEMWKKARDNGTVADQGLLETQIRKQVLSQLRKTTYHWSQMRYDEQLSVVYMAARLAGGYAAVRRALNEIKKRDPSFSPHALLDFGSGLGTATWASHSFWGGTLKEMVCVDSSGPMNTLAERLLRGGSERGDPHIKQVYFRQFLPVSPKVQFDLVVSAFSLSELSSQLEREETLMTLWRKTSSYLVLVEYGTKEGYLILMEARDRLLKKQEKAGLDPRKPFVFAPCPHELPCPRLSQRLTVPCNFTQPYHPLPLPGVPDRQTEKFSYLILSRTDPANTEGRAGGLDWARLTAPVLRRPRHVHCQMCSSSGQLQRLVVTAHRHSRDVYRCARSSDWGDQLPIIQSEEDKHTNTD